MKKEKIFSGDASTDFWHEINKISELSTPLEIAVTLYSMGCALQEFEDKVDRRLEEIEKKLEL